VGDSGTADDKADFGWPLSQAYYRFLVRLAALLTGDLHLAETVAAASCSAVLKAASLGLDGGDALRRLQREIVVRSRRAAREVGVGRPHGAHRRTARGPDADATDFASLPVVTALRALPARAREALVLTYYLDLTEQQAAAIAGVSLPVLRRNLAAALRALPADLPGR
jgi:DNA-directed RNA polymerase specialized sigma24 family protein